VRVWFDAGIEVGMDWEHRILEQIEKAQALVVCWSFAAVSSPWVMREAKIGLDRGILVPVTIHPCSLVPPFDALQSANLTQWDGSSDDTEIQKVLPGRLLIGKKNLARNARLRAGGQKEAMVDLIRSMLIDRALSHGAPFTYKEAEETLRAAAAGEDLQIGEFDQHSLWGALDTIAEQCRRRREPPLDVLVVSKDTGRPGRGYAARILLGDGDDSRSSSSIATSAPCARNWNQDV
jgi:hypothetical protein